MTTENKNLSEVEGIKIQSNYLRGNLKEQFADNTTGGLPNDGVNLIKFHGSYIQWDRDVDIERKRQKLEPLYSFMIRVRTSGGLATPQQWLAVDSITDDLGSGTIKLSTRQAFEIHNVAKRNFKTVIQRLVACGLDSIATAGDVNRNVMCSPNPNLSPAHAEVFALADTISTHLLPKSRAYHDVWLDEKQDLVAKPEEEPIYGKTFLPRKFKITIAVPPTNDTDVFANDIGLIAIIENNQFLGFNVAVGGGMSMTFGYAGTYPRLGSLIGFVPKEQTLTVCEQILGIQRDFGNREDRKKARLKYTIDNYGLNWFVDLLQQRLGWELQAPKKYSFTSSGDLYGWQQDTQKRWHYTLFVEGGRVRDTEGYRLKTGLKQIAQVHEGDFRLTGNQNLIIANIAPEKKAQIEALLQEYGIDNSLKKTGLRLGSIACVALGQCPLAFAEAERYLPSLVDKLDEVVKSNGLEHDAINIRMTGCPNGCARPFLGEIGLVGRAVGRYNLYLGAGFAGERLNTLYKEMLNEEEIIAELTPMIARYAAERQTGEHFGDFVVRVGIVSA